MAGDGVVDPVMDVEFLPIPGPDPVLAHVGLIRQDQCRGNGVFGTAGGLVMVADGGYHRQPVCNRHVIGLQNIVGQQGAQFRVVGPVHRVADVMHASGNFCQFLLPVGITQGFQNVRRPVRHQGAVGHGMVRKAHNTQIPVAGLQQGIHFRMIPDLFISHDHISSTVQYHMVYCTTATCFSV